MEQWRLVASMPSGDRFLFTDKSGRGLIITSKGTHQAVPRVQSALMMGRWVDPAPSTVRDSARRALERSGIVE